MTTITFAPRHRLAFSLALAAWLAASGAAVAQEAKTKAKTKDAPAASATIDLNSATSDELQELPGIGPANAKKIIDGRPYATVDDLSKAGLSASAIEKIKPRVVVRPAAKAAATKKAMTKGEPSEPAKGATAKKAAAKEATPPPTGEKVNVNTADEKTLETLPGVGPALAKAIVAGRPYKSVDDLERVKGLGPAKFSALKDHVSVAMAAPTSPAVPEPTPAPTAPDRGTVAKAATPKAKAATKPAASPLAPGEKVNINTATKEKLDVLPGIGPVKAQAIIDARPFDKIEDIMKVKGIKEGEFGKIKDMITVK